MSAVEPLTLEKEPEYHDMSHVEEKFEEYPMEENILKIWKKKKFYFNFKIRRIFYTADNLF